jgi:hypothetical protein
MCGSTVSPVNKDGVFLNNINQVYTLQTSLMNQDMTKFFMWVPVEKYGSDLFPLSFHVIMAAKAIPYTIAVANILCMYVLICLRMFVQAIDTLPKLSH